MNPQDVAKILLVRSVEEAAPELIDGELLVDAAVRAGAVDEPRAWLARRAEHVLQSLRAEYHVLLDMTEILSRRPWPIVGVSVALGLLANYLGPSQRIHALYNPISLLILWNFAVFVALALSLLIARWRAVKPHEPNAPAGRGKSLDEPVPRSRPGRASSVALYLVRRSVPSIWIRTHKLLSDNREESARMAGVAKAFWGHWVNAMRPLFRVGARRLLNFAGMGVIVGAVLGMFIRGLFLDYHIVWRSTFITEPQTVSAILTAFVGLPAFLLGTAPPDSETAAALMLPQGIPAGAWIWLYAGAAVLFVFLPRFALGAVYALRLRTLGRSLDVGLDDPYFARVIADARKQRLDEIIAAIRADVRVETAKFAEGIATYVCEMLYDGSIVPRLQRFREEGGRLQDLETAIAKDCEDFEAELNSHFPQAQSDFEQGLSRAITRTVQEDAEFEAAAHGLGGDVHRASSEAVFATGNTISAGLNTAVGSTVSAAVALVLATVSGGFGESLGIALAVVFGTTGPVGFLIGGLAGLVLAGGSYFLGRNRAAEAIKAITLPGRVVRSVLWPKRLQKLVTDGRSKCHDSVESLIKERLEPMAPQIADQIWTKVKPLIDERLRPGSGG